MSILKMVRGTSKHTYVHICVSYHRNIHTFPNLKAAFRCEALLSFLCYSYALPGVIHAVIEILECDAT